VTVSSDRGSLLPAPRLPWDYSEEPAADEPTVPNVPTPEGRMLGRELARLADIEEAKLRKQFPRLQPRCDDCALRSGTDPNGCVETLMDVIKCVVEQERVFYCHKGVKDGQPKRMCAGFGFLASTSADISPLLAAAEVLS
jgi:hypothetical protein